jgi:hypothetical protein
VRTFTYIIGIPGAGKSTLMAEITREMPLRPVEQPFPHTVWYGEQRVIAELGKRRSNGFSGTDALSMSIQPLAEEWVRRQTSFEHLMAEGDRLANSGFFAAVRAAGYDLRVLYLVTAPEIAAERRARRAAALGVKPQSPAWLRGRHTKVARLAGEGCVAVSSFADVIRLGLDPFGRKENPHA